MRGSGRPLSLRPSEAAGVRQLQADQQVVGAAEVLAVGRQRASRRAARSASVLGEQELVGVGAAVVAHGDRLAAPDQLGPAQAEVPPAPPRQVGRPAVDGAVPALHRQDGEAIADGAGRAPSGLGQRGVRPGSTSASNGSATPSSDPGGLA